MFVGRKRELAALNRRYGSSDFEFVGIYGRRRVGKTALISEFAKDLPCGYCTAVEDDVSANLKLLSRAVFQLQSPNADPELAPVYPDFTSAVEAAFTAARGRRGVLVIDEFPYLAASYPAFPSVLQSAIDRYREESGLFLVLCGSSLSFMREQLLDRKSPLYGRRTAQIELKPFDFFESRAFFGGMGPIDAACLYGAVGGVPLYLRQFDASLTLADNIAQVFFNADSILFEEPANLLKQEVSKAAPYNAVISAMADGASQHNEIATASGVEARALDYYLKELARLGLAEREEPVGGRGSRKGVWHVSDNLFRFWYRFVRPRKTLVERGLADGAAQRVVEGLPLYMGPVFEELGRDWLWRELAAGRLDFAFTDVGRWWGNDPAARSQAEVDVVAVDEGRTVLVGECKWQNAPTGPEQLQKLDARATLAGGGPATPRWMFSRAGFTDACRELAATMPAARLVTFDEMLT
jgi:hypothetical protein